MALIREFNNTFTADGNASSNPVHRDEIDGKADLELSVQYKPVGDAPTGTTIAFAGKLEHSLDGVTYEDVPSGGITTIAVGTEARATKAVDLSATVLHKFVRVKLTVSITGSPDYKTGTVGTAQIAAA